MKRGVMPLHALVVILVILITGLSLGYFIVLLRQAAENTDVSFAVGRLPQDVPRGVPVVAPDEVDKAFDKFVALGDGKTGPCLEKFTWSDLSDFQIEMQIDDAGTLFLLRNKEGQLVKNRYAAGKKMCVVGGLVDSTEVLVTEFIEKKARERGEKFDAFNDPILKDLGLTPKLDEKKRFLAAHNFYVNWVHEITEGSYNLGVVQFFYTDARKSKKKILSPDFTIPDKILVRPKEKMINVQFKDGTEIVPEKNLLRNEKPNKEDGGFVYIEKGTVCLFGTFDTSLDWSKNRGIHKDFIKKVSLASLSCTTT
ncbi:hypothetical protein J4207_03940 [Candidatus Woesearchaeota archaeon]|nr:hypothetical protein [Candidatus Woesearchaeota archaeon]